MATTKVKGTNAKIKELKGIKPEKITDEELTNLKKLVKDVNLMHHELGVFEGRKYQMLQLLKPLFLVVVFLINHLAIGILLTQLLYNRCFKMH